jgi:aminoglycoside phosphotransferase (APT) family kinase protein
VGHSAETLIVTVLIGGERRDVVIRVRPEPPGLLEPYDLQRQFTILRALESTPVRSPRALWFDPSGEVLGREFYVMERLPGRVIERGVPDEVAGDPALVRRMCESMIEQIAAIHTVDLQETRLAELANGRDQLTLELDHWSSEIERVKRGTLPALELLVDELRARQPEPCPRVTLVHGDTKPGNFAFVDGEVSAVFDWEMATVGDPLADIGWAEVNWRFPGFVTAADGAPSADELVGRWEALTGIRAQHRPVPGAQGLRGASCSSVATSNPATAPTPGCSRWRTGCLHSPQALATLGIDVRRNRARASGVLPRLLIEGERGRLSSARKSLTSDRPQGPNTCVSPAR